MLLKLKDIKEAEGISIPFAYGLDLSEYEFFGEKPLKDAVQVCGKLVNRAGAMELIADADFIIDTVCSRCAKPIRVPKHQLIQRAFADSLEDEENDDIFLIEGDTIDVDEMISEAIVLDMEFVHLCSEDCKGLCPRCGADLNMTKCSCEPEVMDERLAVLKDILNGMSEN